MRSPLRPDRATPAQDNYREIPGPPPGDLPSRPADTRTTSTHGQNHPIGLIHSLHPDADTGILLTPAGSYRPRWNTSSFKLGHSPRRTPPAVPGSLKDIVYPMCLCQPCRRRRPRCQGKELVWECPPRTEANIPSAESSQSGCCRSSPQRGAEIRPNTLLIHRTKATRSVMQLGVAVYTGQLCDVRSEFGHIHTY